MGAAERLDANAHTEISARKQRPKTALVARLRFINILLDCDRGPERESRRKDSSKLECSEPAGLIDRFPSTN